MDYSTSIRVSKDIRLKLKNFSKSNGISTIDALEYITNFILSNGYTVSDLKQLNTEGSFDRIYKRVEDVISIVRGIEKDNLKPLVRQVRDIDMHVDQILSNMQIVQEQEEPPALTGSKPVLDLEDKDVKYYYEKANKGAKLRSATKQLLEKLDSRTEISPSGQKRYILNDEVERMIIGVMEHIENF